MLATFLLIAANKPTIGHPIELNTDLLANRFFVTATTSEGVKVRWYADSAGGGYLTLDAAKRLGAKLIQTNIKGEDGKPMQMVAFPKFQSFPLLDVQLPVFDMVTNGVIDKLGTSDGMLGQRWFRGRTWTFDYQRGKLVWRANGDLPKHEKKHEAPLFFKKGKSGGHETDFARFQVGIDGEQIDFLFDTGATDTLTPEALQFVGDGGPALRATSFMALGLFTRLHTKHPDWRVFSGKTMTGSSLLEVPKMTIGGFEVGPVWFSVQPDFAFHKYMAQWMDKETEGAIGGSALHYLRVSVDWPAGKAVFEKP